MNCNSNTMSIPSVINNVCENRCINNPINVICKQMILPDNQRILAVQNENNAIKKTFLVPKITENGDDLEDKSFSLIIRKADNITVTLEIQNPTILENYIQLDWIVDSSYTDIVGKIYVQISASGDNFVWKTIPDYFNIIASIK